ncbi:DNA methyltransferase [Weissella confusa]
MDVKSIVGSKSGNQPRIIMVTDFERLVALDTKLNDTLDIKFLELPQHFDFFLPWQGRERVEFEAENPADIKAAERFAKIYDVLFKENTEIINVKEKRKTVAKHVFTENTVSETAFNNFLIRVLFALFAEDTDIFPRGAFTSVIKKMTNEDGSNMNMILRELFDVLDKPENVRGTLANWLGQFPYVNGSLFTEPHEDIVFSANSRKLIIDAGELIDWTQVNPDIFGSMVQAVTGEDDRSHLGMHYTSVPNIMKVIKPLFLDDLNDQFEAAYNDAKELDKLNDRMSRMKFFDPAAGSGNFLIITYKELRRLEIKIMKRLAELTGSFLYVPIVSLKQFYGIEIEEFATDIAKVSLWIAEHQMNVELRNELNGVVRPTLPLQNAGAIITGNSLRLDWEKILNLTESDLVYTFGNPPYLGSKKQNETQKSDLKFAIGDIKKYKLLDYISGWFFKGAQLLKRVRGGVAFVSTNSIVQGEQVSILWPTIYSLGIKIDFAYKPFKWNNNAKNNAGVTVVIIGLNNLETVSELSSLYFEDSIVRVKSISPYLIPGDPVPVFPATESLFNLPKINFGSMANDGGFLIFTPDEYTKFIEENPGTETFFKVLLGSDEYINDKKRYALWIDEHNKAKALSNASIAKVIENVENYRLNSTRAATKKLAETGWQFGEVRYKNTNAILVPRVSSENRYYVPMGFISPDSVISDSALAIYDAELWLLGLLESRMHMVWLENIGGKLESRYRYSVGLVYNTFPVPPLSKQRKAQISNQILEILDLREEIGGSLAQLYSKKTMPKSLMDAHSKLDEIVDKAYKSTAFTDDSQRLSLLLKMYSER